jgi:hypothetical protein
LDLSTLDLLSSQLEYVTCQTKVEEVEVLLGALREKCRSSTERESKGVPASLLKRVIYCLKKFAFKKYETEFTEALADFEGALGDSQRLGC